MSSAPPKHPKKKRRIDEVPEDNCLPGPSNEKMPLVSPQLVKKSSKDPNRGMYPLPKRKHRKINSGTSPPSEPVKPSVRYKKLPQRNKKEKLKAVDSTASEISEEHAASNSNQSNVKFECNSTSTNTEKKLNISALKKKRETKISHSSSLSRNVKCLGEKISSSWKQKYIRKQKSVKPSNSGLNKELPGTSGWNREEIDDEPLFKSIPPCYGLFDTDFGNAENEVDYFKHLPIHIIEYILCQLPIFDLMTCRLVCTQWHDIIDNERFMEWKKRYYKFKKICSEPYSDPKRKVNELLIDYGYCVLEDSIGSILRYMGKGFNRTPSSDMYNLLIQTPKGELADQVLSERFPEFNGKDSRVWCQFAVAILISETVGDIISIYKSLFPTCSPCHQPDVIDAMYCIASCLLLFQSWGTINSGLHFRLYYVLYLIDNHISKFQRQKLTKLLNHFPDHHKQSIHSCSFSDFDYLTSEQKRILNHQFGMNQKIRIIALAGTGKTTTLIYLSRLYPQIKFLYLSFNKLISEEAKKRFPSNVVCKTAHSLAYADSGHPLFSKLTTTLRPLDLIGHFTHNEDRMHIYVYASLILSTINNFTISNSTKMDLIHVPSKECSYSSVSSKKYRDRVLKDAYKIWNKMINEKDPFKITHDVYLKLYHLKQPVLHEYQCIMVDDAQDCNPVILDILTSQSIPVIFVGDPYQQIYKFRGAKNALQSIKATHTYHLNQSFRFGSQIAYIAACVLQELFYQTAATIVGNTKDSFVNGKVGGQYAVIARTNIGLFNEALRMIVFKRLKKNEPTVINSAFAGGISSYGFDQILQIYNLKNKSEGGLKVEDKFISRFKSFTDLANYARYSEDTDLCSKIEIVNQHGHNISRFIAILKDKCNNPIELANVVFSTVHKAKGLEFDTVCLADDYAIPTALICSENITNTVYGEASFLYVALTRAKSFLLLPEKIKRVLLKAHEKFEYPVSTQSVLGTNQILECVQCKAEFTPHTVLTVVRRKMIMASDREIQEGPLCMKCCSDPNMRPDIHINGLIMYLDPTSDCAHRFMSSIVGPLPTDPPIVHDSFIEYQNADRIFVINLNINVR